MVLLHESSSSSQSMLQSQYESLLAQKKEHEAEIARVNLRLTDSAREKDELEARLQLEKEEQERAWLEKQERLLQAEAELKQELKAAVEGREVTQRRVGELEAKVRVSLSVFLLAFGADAC